MHGSLGALTHACLAAAWLPAVPTQTLRPAPAVTDTRLALEGSLTDAGVAGWIDPRTGKRTGSGNFNGNGNVGSGNGNGNSGSFNGNGNRASGRGNGSDRDGTGNGLGSNHR